MSHDNQLRDAVEKELGWEPSITAAHIGVAANAGVVTLTGHVETFAQKRAAERAARRVEGVKAVAEELEVRLRFSIKRDDGAIAAAVLNRFSWDASVPANAVKATVEHGRVTLTGQVEWQFQKEAAEQHVRPLMGVTGVSSELTIKPRVTTTNIGDNINDALTRSWFSDPKMITVTANGGRVRRTGTAHSLADRLIAGKTAWAAPGATYVENDITVS